MKVVFFLILLLHGIIHFTGFLKAFNFHNFEALKANISKTQGIFWLITGLLLSLTAVCFLFQIKYWWLLAFISIFCSQVLIFSIWKDAKPGTVNNLIILLVILPAFFSFNFDQKVEKEIHNILEPVPEFYLTLNENQIAHLPDPVQNWLIQSGAVGHAIIDNVYVKQNFKLKLSPDQEHWYTAKAEQYFNTKHPAFVWSIDLRLFSFIQLKGRDRFLDGKGEMLIKLFSVIPIVNEKHNEKINQGSLQRYLGEIAWFPTAAVSPYIIWEAEDDYSAKATMTYGGTKGSGIFHFNEAGDMIKFTAIRYMSNEEDAEPTEWVIETQKTTFLNGLRIPVKATASWIPKEGKWTWAELEIIEVVYY